MKKYVILLSFIILLLNCTNSFAVKFKDVSDSSWASESVYDMVKMGLTTGYPDGTFRGNKTVTRYEMASLMSKLLKYMSDQGTSGISPDRVRQIAKEEISVALRGKSDGWKISGMYGVRAKLAGVFGENAKALTPQYRIKMNISNEINSDLKFGFDFDTRTTPLWGDEGFGATWDYLNWGDFDIFKAGVMDVWTNATIDGIFAPLTLDLSNGIGDSLHLGDKISLKNSTLFYNTVLGFSFGRNSVMTNRNASNKYSGFYFRDASNFGILGLATFEADATLFVDVNQIKPTFNKRDWNVLTKIKSSPSDNVRFEGRLGLSDLNGRGIYLAGLLWVDNLFSAGTKLFLEGHKLSSQYITTYGDSWVGTDVMDYFITDGNNLGRIYVGAKINQQISEKWDLQTRLTYHATGGGFGSPYLFRIEPGVKYKAAKKIMTYFYYRYWYDYAAQKAGDRIETGVFVNF